MLVGNAGAAVRDGNRDAVRPLRIDGDFDIPAEFQPVIDQVDHDAAQGLRVRENRHPAFSGKSKGFSGVGIVADEAVDERMQVGLAALPGDLVASAGQGKPLLDQRLHFLQVALQLFPGVAVTQEISAQPHPRDRSLKAARDPRQNLDPFHRLLGNAPLHGVERGSGARHFLRTILRERPGAQIRTQAVGRALETRQRSRRELHGNPGAKCENAELNGERRGQPGRTHPPRRAVFDRHRTAVLEVNKHASFRSIRWIEIDIVRVVAGPKLGPESRQKRFPLRFERLICFPAPPENVSICGFSEAVQPCRSLFGLDPVEDSDLRRDAPHEIVIRLFVAGGEDIEGDQTKGQQMRSQQTGEQDDRQPAEQ